MPGVGSFVGKWMLICGSGSCCWRGLLFHKGPSVQRPDCVRMVGYSEVIFGIAGVGKQSFTNPVIVESPNSPDCEICGKRGKWASALFVPSSLPDSRLRCLLVARADDARRSCISTNKLHVHGVRDAAEEFSPFSRTIGQVSSKDRSMRFASSSCG